MPARHRPKVEGRPALALAGPDQAQDALAHRDEVRARLDGADVVALARRAREADLDVLDDAARARREDDDVGAEVDRLLDAVGDEHDRRAGPPPDAVQLLLH